MFPDSDKSCIVDRKACFKVGTDALVCPYFVVLYFTEQITSLLVNRSTRQLEVAIILNYELCFLS